MRKVPSISGYDISFKRQKWRPNFGFDILRYDVHSSSWFTRSKFGQSLIKVFISRYLSSVNSKINKMAELDLVPKRSFDWSIPIKVRQSFRKIGRVSVPAKFIKFLSWQSFWCRFTHSKNFVKENFDPSFWWKTLYLMV